MKVMFAILPIVASLFIVACNRSSSPTRPSQSRQAGVAADVIATVEGHAIRLADFEEKLKRSHGRSTASPQEREALLRELVKSEAIYVRAAQAGFDQRPEIARKVKAFIVDQFIEEQLKEQPEEQPVSEAEIEEYYREHSDRYHLAEKVRFAVIQIAFSPKATEEKKTEVVRRAETVLAEAAAMRTSERTFGVLAQRHSEDPATRYIGGDAGWLSHGESSRWTPAVIDAAVALRNPGELSPVVQTSNACYLVKLIEKQGAGPRPLKEVAEAIRYQVAIEKRHRTQEAIYERMMTGLRVQINQGLLKSVPAPPSPPETTAFALPGS